MILQLLNLGSVTSFIQTDVTNTVKIANTHQKKTLLPLFQRSSSAYSSSVKKKNATYPLPYLLREGRRRICTLGGPPPSPSREGRCRHQAGRGAAAAASWRAAAASWEGAAASRRSEAAGPPSSAAPRRGPSSSSRRSPRGRPRSEVLRINRSAEPRERRPSAGTALVL